MPDYLLYFSQMPTLKENEWFCIYQFQEVFYKDRLLQVPKMWLSDSEELIQYNFDKLWKTKDIEKAKERVRCYVDLKVTLLCRPM